MAIIRLKISKLIFIRSAHIIYFYGICFHSFQLRATTKLLYRLQWLYIIFYRSSICKYYYYASCSSSFQKLIFNDVPYPQYYTCWPSITVRNKSISDDHLCRLWWTFNVIPILAILIQPEIKYVIMMKRYIHFKLLLVTWYRPLWLPSKIYNSYNILFI